LRIVFLACGPTAFSFDRLTVPGLLHNETGGIKVGLAARHSIIIERYRGPQLRRSRNSFSFYDLCAKGTLDRVFGLSSRFNIIRSHVHMNSTPILVAVVDDDESVRESLPDLLKELGFDAKSFATARDFLRSRCLDNTTILISDVAMPGMTGPELFRELVSRGHAIPTIFITAHEDVATRPDVVEGAITCLIKPFNDTVLLEALKRALDDKPK
jgi:CheY-like chemotaxis protein